MNMWKLDKKMALAIYFEEESLVDNPPDSFICGVLYDGCHLHVKGKVKKKMKRYKDSKI
jgi:hypothetical protein